MDEFKQGKTIPSRSERRQCHQNRDRYFQCLDQHNIDDPQDRGDKCNELRKQMFNTCPETWATYFEQLRAMQRQRAKKFSDSYK